MLSTLMQNADVVLRYLDECRQLMSWVDVLDIVFIGALLSIALVWLHGRTARAVLFALIALLVTFATASTLKMYMTSMVFQFGLTALVLSIIVIFQDDFRRVFEGLASWRPWGEMRTGDTVKLADLLGDAAKVLAESKTGALIVLQGRQAIELHLRAGIPLQGTVSIPLLLSIFDSSSPGHDGGMIIVDGRISKFGVHLPLSRNSEGTGRLGTRHAAALGLVEKCDALVLVVSEETGAVSLAHDGKITIARTTGEVRSAIKKHLVRVGPRSLPRTVWEIPWGRLTFSYTAALALWFLFARPVNPVLRTVEVNIVYRGLPKGWEAKAPDPSRVRLTLAGPEGPLVGIDPTAMAVSVDLAHASEGQQRFVLGATDVSLPAHIKIKRFEPPEISVQAYQTKEADVPVEATWLNAGGRAPSSATLRIDPPRITVKFPSATSVPRTLSTEPIDLRELKRLGRVRAKLRIPSENPSAELSAPSVEIFLKPTGE